MKYRVRVLLLCALWLLLTAALSAETQQASRERFDQAMTLFAEGELEQAAQQLRRVAESATAERLHPEAWFWLGRVRLAQQDSVEAGRYFDHLINSYPDHPRVPEALYHRARAQLIGGDYQTALVQFEEFVSRYPDSAYVANAYYWSGEALLALGHRERAARLFETVVDNYPTSFRVEAAGYRLSLIELSERDEQLQRLLQWSHEEHLRTIEAFERSRRAWEEALAVYRDGAAGELSADERDVARLRQSIAELANQLDAARAELQQVRAARGDAVAVEGDLANRLRVAEIKEQALLVKERLLRDLEMERAR